MSVDSVLAFLLIASFHTTAASSREIIFTADMIIRHQITKETLKTTDIPSGSNSTLICKCKSCSTIEFLKNGIVNFSTNNAVDLCKIKQVNGSKLNSARYTCEVKTHRDTMWLCRGKIPNGSWVVSRAQQLSISSKRISTDVIETTISTGLGTSGPGVQTPTEINQNNLIIITAVTAVLVVVVFVVTVILCLKKRKNKRVTTLNSTSLEDKPAVKETPGSRESVRCVMEENEIYESNDDVFAKQGSTPENRKSICTQKRKFETKERYFESRHQTTHFENIAVN